ncbi:MAG: hypothetical protein PUJ11_05475 [Eubacteriaceae bacterium]|nr:hypothetical protein [Eubacteriaceae bacterium]
MVTIDVRTTLIWLLLAALVILVVYLIVAVKNLVTTIKKTNKILEDAAVISEVAAKKAVEVDEIVGDVHGVVSDLAKAVQGTSTIGAVTNVVKAAGSVASTVKQNKEKNKVENNNVASNKKKKKKKR